MNDKKNNSATKYLVVGIVALVLLLVLVRAGGDSPEKNSAQVNTTSSSSTENTEEESIDSVEIPAVPETDKPDGEVPFGDSNFSDSDVPNVGEEEGFGGSDGEKNITNYLFPCTEIEKSAGSRGTYLGESNTINGHKKLCWITSFIPEEELTFSIGYMEGCPVGNVEKNGEVCTDVNNWREEKRKVPATEGAYEKAGYYGQITKPNDPDYITNSFISIIPEKPEDLEGLGSYFRINSAVDTISTVFSIKIDKTAAVIVLN